MEIHVQLTRERIDLGALEPTALGCDVGSWVEFRGLVRGEEGGRSIAALEYEAYEDMAARTMRRILEALFERHPFHRAVVVHRLGVVPVGEAAIVVSVSSRHRQESLAVLQEFMDRLKQDVPIWKRRALPVEELNVRK